MGAMRFVALAALAASAFAQIPLPKVTQLPITADSGPFLAASKNLAPVDLAKVGYVEEEYILSGSANVYDLTADGNLSVQTPNAPYGVRVLVRRPATQARFSGAVYVELMNAARRMDWSMMWGYSHDHFLQRGDAWIGVSLPGATPGLQKYNAARYAGVSFANPKPGAACPGNAKGGASDVEPGLMWDVLSQLAASVKSTAAVRPMAPLQVGGIYLTSQGGDITFYINSVHDHAKLANGKPAWDGYLVRNPAAPSRVNQCAPALAQDDPRRKIKDIAVPVIGVVAQGELADSAWARKPDSDAPTGRYRHYEVAAASHIDKYPYTALANFAEQAAAGTPQGNIDFPFAAPCEPAITMQDSKLMSYVFDMSFQALDEWSRKGKTPPKATPLDLSKINEYGIAPGGIRSPFSDVPAAVYTTTTGGPGNCREMGSTKPVDDVRITALYGSRKNYETKFAAAADAMLKAGFVTPSDAKELKAHPKP